MKKLLFGIFIFLFSSAQFHAQTRKIDSLKKVLRAAGNDTLKVIILNDLGGYLIGARQNDSASFYLDKGFDLAEELEYESGMSIAANREGILYLNKNDNTKAKGYFLRALVHVRKSNDKKSEADITSNLGIIYSNMGDYAKALEYYRSALKIREDIKDTRGTATSMMSVANIYYLGNNFDEALKFYEDLLKKENLTDDPYFNAQILYNTGLVRLEKKDYNKALLNFKEALKIDEEIGDKQGVALIYTRLGSLYSIQKNYLIALEWLQKGNSILKELKDKRGVAETYGEMGIIYDSLRQYDKAMDCFRNLIKIAREIDSKINIRKFYLHTSNHYKIQGDFRGAYNYYTYYKHMEDTIKNENSMSTIAEIETLYETEKKEKEIQLLKTEQELREASILRRNQLLYTSLALAVAASVTLFLLYNRRQLKRKNALEKKNFELERNALSAQMNPHFIFNSLGSISGFISENEKEKAVEYLGVFARLIRHNLEQSREQLVSVDREAAMLRSYLHLQQLRFNNKFTFEVKVDDSVDSSAAIPPMFIQPFVENAVLHGIVPKEENGHIEVSFFMKGEELIVCEVKDDGIGRKESEQRKTDLISSHKSLAMTITEERMEIINSSEGEKISLEIEDLKPGTLIRLKFFADFV